MHLKRKHEGIVLTQFYRDKPNLILPAHIEFTRIAPRNFDDDNLTASFKNLRDTVAQMFFPDKQRGQADSSKELTWSYTQKKGKTKQYSIEIRILANQHEA